MNIAVLSGKGGTGKTLVSVNLAFVAASSTYIDCDVEEPNGHLFFKPNKVVSQEVSVAVPMVDADLCTGCRKCVEFCRFNALAFVNNTVRVLESICHSCGGCVLLCPYSAINEKEEAIGRLQQGESNGVRVVSGFLNPGEASGVPIIRELLKHADHEPETFTIIDCPPGSACTVMESIKGADYCVLVAEPTFFGVHNLRMVHQLVRLFGKPYGVVLNKCLEGDNPAADYCVSNDIPVICKIDFDHELGLLSSNAQIVSSEMQNYHQLFTRLLHRIAKEAHHETAAHP